MLQESTIIPERQEVIIPTHIDVNAQDSPDSTIECTDDNAYPSGPSDDLMIFELHEADNLCEEALSLVNNVNDIFNTMDYPSNLVAYGNCRMPYKDITNNNACSNIDEGKIRNSPERHEISSTVSRKISLILRKMTIWKWNLKNTMTMTMFLKAARRLVHLMKKYPELNKKENVS